MTGSTESMIMVGEEVAVHVLYAGALGFLGDVSELPSHRE